MDLENYIDQSDSYDEYYDHLDIMEDFLEGAGAPTNNTPRYSYSKLISQCFLCNKDFIHKDTQMTLCNDCGGV